MMERANTPSTEVIDLADLVRSVRNGWRTVLVCTLLGIGAAVAVLVLVAPAFDGKASVVLKTGTNNGSSSTLAAAIGSIADAGGGASGAGGLSGLKSGVETEVEIMKSRSLGAELVDSLQLQMTVTKPRALPTPVAIANATLPGSFKLRAYKFKPVAGATTTNSFVFKSATDSGTATIGQPAKLEVGTITLAPTAPRDGFTVIVRDREDAITRVIDNLTIEKPKSEVAHIAYRSSDSITAAEVPNLLLRRYLERRRTIDRGINQRSAEFLANKVDSLGTALTAAERALRAERESSGVLNPMAMGQMDVENANRLRSRLTELQVQDSALKQLVGQIKSGTASPRQLAAYPQFIGNAAIINVVSNLISVESERQALLETATPEDRGVKALTERARALESQLLPMAMTTLNALASERAGIESRLASIQSSLVGVPRAAESYTRLEREILDRSRLFAGLQTQLVDARLAAITEGGDVRTLDSAVVPKKLSFPKKSLTLATGIGSGLFIGVLLAALLGLVGGSMHDAQDVERRMGLPAVRFETSSPLLVGGQAARTILVAPINDRANARPVAERLVETAISRSLTATVLDLTNQAIIAQTPVHATESKLLTGGSTNGNGFDANAAIARLEETYDLVVVHLPELRGRAAGAVLSSARPVLLVAPERRIERTSLQSSIELLRRVGSPCAGVVLHGDDRRALRS